MPLDYPVQIAQTVALSSKLLRFKQTAVRGEKIFCEDTKQEYIALNTAGDRNGVFTFVNTSSIGYAAFSTTSSLPNVGDTVQIMAASSSLYVGNNYTVLSATSSIFILNVTCSYSGSLSGSWKREATLSQYMPPLFSITSSGVIAAPNTAVGRPLKDTGWDAPDLGYIPYPGSSEGIIVRQSSDDTFLYLDKGQLYIASGSSALSAVPVGISVIYQNPDSPRTAMDVETTLADGTQLSLITGNSDTIGLNGLPIIQEGQQPNIGAYPSYLVYGRILS